MMSTQRELADELTAMERQYGKETNVPSKVALHAYISFSPKKKRSQQYRECLALDVEAIIGQGGNSMMATKQLRFCCFSQCLQRSLISQHVFNFLQCAQRAVEKAWGTACAL